MNDNIYINKVTFYLASFILDDLHRFSENKKTLLFGKDEPRIILNNNRLSSYFIDLKEFSENIKPFHFGILNDLKNNTEIDFAPFDIYYKQDTFLSWDFLRVDIDLLKNILSYTFNNLSFCRKVDNILELYFT